MPESLPWLLFLLITDQTHFEDLWPPILICQNSIRYKYVNMQFLGIHLTLLKQMKLTFTRTALHHLSERLHCCLLCTLEAALGQKRADNNLQSAPPGQDVVLCWAGSCFTNTPTLKRNIK